MNQHYEFWVSYYEELAQPKPQTEKQAEAQNRRFEDKNRRIFGHRWEAGALTIPCQEQSFCAQVCYPGLLVGLGNTHASGQTKAEIQLGMTLDTVTGLPYLPGSTVKGILRSAFLQNREYVAAMLEEQGISLTPQQVEALELDSFGRQQPYGDYTITAEYGGGRDVFFDAWPVQPDADKHLLGPENITPHRAKKPELEGLTAPIPLNLIKVLPGVVFQFRFQLADTVLGKDEAAVTVSAAQKLELYRQLLLDLGAGAKTNVGFGVLKECSEAGKNHRYLEQLPEKEQKQKPHQEDKPKKQVKKENTGRTRQENVQISQIPQPKTLSTIRSRADIQKGMVLEGRVKNIRETFAFVELIPPKPGQKFGVDGFLHISEISWERVEAGCIGDYIRLNEKVRVLVTRVEEGGKKISVSLKRVKG